MNVNGDILLRNVATAALALGGVGVAASYVAWLQTGSSTYDAGVGVTALMVLAGSLIVGLIELRGGGCPRLGVRLYSASGVALLIAHPFIYYGQIDQAYPALMHASTVGICLLMLQLPLSAAIAAAGAYGFLSAYMRLSAVGPFQACIEGVMSANMALAVAWAQTLLTRAAAQIEDGAIRARAAHDDLLRVQARAFERARWNGLIHDKVLGTLRLVARERTGDVPVGAKQLAHDAAVAINGLRQADCEPSGHAIERLCVDMGLNAIIDIRGDVEDLGVRGTLIDAAGAAIANVALHAGTTQVQVVGDLSPTAAVLTVHDRGVGFDSGSVPSDRLGLSHGLRLRMASIGGAADIESAPGQGTRVQLSWLSGTVEPDRPQWQLGGFKSLIGFGLVATFSHIAVGTRYLDDFTEPQAVLASMLLIPVVTLGLAFAPLRRRFVYGALVLMCMGISPGLTVLLRPFPADDWRWWYLGASLDAAAAVMSFRVRPYLGPLVTLLVTTSVYLVLLVRGEGFIINIITGHMGPLACAVAGAVIKIVMDSTANQVDRSEKRRLEAVAAKIRAEELVREVDRRIGALSGAILSILDAIQHAKTPITDDLRCRARQLEANLRDQLVAGDLMDSPLFRSVNAARERGVDVEVGADAALSPGVEELRIVAKEILDRALAYDRVEIRWRPSREGRVLGYVTFIGPWRERDLCDLNTESAEFVDDASAVFIVRRD